MSTSAAPHESDRPMPSPDGELPPHPHLASYYERPEVRQRYVNGLFNEAAPHYEWIINVMAPFGEGKRYRREALARAGVTAGMRVLDVATGTGPVLRELRTLVGPTGSIVGLDPSIGMLRENRRHGGPGTVITRGVGERLPFPDASFDFLSMGYALRHLPDLHATFREFRRVLRPGGTALVLEISPPSSRLGHLLLRLYLGRLVPFATRIGTRNRTATELMRYYWDTVEQCVPPPTILEALRAAGFASVERGVELAVFSEYRARK